MTNPCSDLAILGLGTAIPHHSINLDESIAIAEELFGAEVKDTRLLRALYRRSGVQNRHTVIPYRTALQWGPRSEPGDSAVAVATRGPSTRQRMAWYEEHAPLLAWAAASEAMAHSQLEPSDVTHLVTVSCTGFSAPGVDLRLMRELELSPRTERTHVGFMGCHGAINGLRVARALASTRPDAVVLLCAVELCSLHYQFAWDPSRAVGNAIFSDGAAAIVARGTYERPAWRVTASGSCLIPHSDDAMSWRVGDHGFEMWLAPTVPDAIARNLRPWLDGWLAEQGLEVSDVGSWAIHPGGPRILNSVEEALGLDRQQTSMSREILRNYGNLSSPTVLFIIDRLRKQNAALPCVALAFGPGLMAEALLIV